MPNWVDRVLWIGPVAFLMAACAWSMLDASYSSDTWIGLAAGRHIMEQLEWGRFHETFPRQDVFSYTFYRQPWFNQNWLSNLGYYWVYARLGPDAVVYGTWAMVACIHAFVLLAVYWRTESWLAACLAAALVGIGARDFLEPRAAVVGLLCMAALWALICAIEGQREQARWWPVVPILPLLCFWSNAHGGFTFGYGMLALYCGYWVLARPFRIAGTAASGGQILSIAAVLVAAVAINSTLSPFGIESLVHPERIASSAVFRQVSEWLPAYSHVADRYPPMWRFWWMLVSAAIGFLLLRLTGRIVVRADLRDAPIRAAARWSWFDAALVLTCLCMTLWMRRFAPFLYIVSAPVLAIGVMRLGAPLLPYCRGCGTPALKIAAALAAAVVGGLTWTAAHRDLVVAYTDQPATGFLERTRGDQRMREAISFLEENRLQVNLFADWGDAGSVMFYAPLARVFIDPRGEQVYTEEHYRRYYALNNPRTPADRVRRILDQANTDAALVRITAYTAALQSALLASPDWFLVFVNEGYGLFLRVGSPAVNRLGELTREGRDWQPTRAGTITPDAQASRAVVLLNTPPADPVRALDHLKRAVARRQVLGRMFYPTIALLLAQTAGREAATEYILLQTSRVTSDAALDPKTRSALLASLVESRKALEHADGAARPADPPSAGTAAR